jgi:hypothetical protein
MIDDPWKTDLLMSMLTEALPIEANVTQYLAGELMQKSPEITIPKKCNVTSIFYTGDMGGILCGLDIGGPLCQRSCRLNRIGTFGGADSRKWLDTDKRTKIG